MFYANIKKHILTKKQPLGCFFIKCFMFAYYKNNSLYYFMIFATTPEPTVLPPSRIAKRKPASIAIG